jgi:hypothetical protein
MCYVFKTLQHSGARLLDESIKEEYPLRNSSSSYRVANSTLRFLIEVLFYPRVRLISNFYQNLKPLRYKFLKTRLATIIH